MIIRIISWAPPKFQTDLVYYYIDDDPIKLAYNVEEDIKRENSDLLCQVSYYLPIIFLSLFIATSKDSEIELANHGDGTNIFNWAMLDNLVSIKQK